MRVVVGDEGADLADAGCPDQALGLAPRRGGPSVARRASPLPCRDRIRPSLRHDGLPRIRSSPVLPRSLQLAQQLAGHLGHLAAVLIVHPIAFHQVADGDLALVGTQLAAQQVVEDALAQGRVAVAHGLDAELVEHRLHGGQAAGDDRLPVGAQTRQISQRIHMAGCHAQVLQQREPFAGDGRMAEIGVDQRQQRLGRARRTHRVLPAQPLEAVHMCCQLLAAVQPRLAHGRLGDLAAAEELLREGHAANLQRLAPSGLLVHPDDALGGTAADVHHQAQLMVEWQAVSGPQVDEASFLAPGHHLDGAPQRRARLLQEGADVVRHPEGVGGHRPEGFQLQALQPLGKAPQRLQRPLACLFGQLELPVQAGAQPDRFLDLVEDAQLGTGRGLVDLGQQQPETVGTQVNGSQGPSRQGIAHRIIS